LDQWGHHDQWGDHDQRGDHDHGQGHNDHQRGNEHLGGDLDEQGDHHDLQGDDHHPGGHQQHGWRHGVVYSDQRGWRGVVHPGRRWAAFTGAASVPMLFVALALLGLGVASLLAGSRRRRRA
jgi:hypothetical protein